jgi:hypothetical protein
VFLKAAHGEADLLHDIQHCCENQKLFSKTSALTVGHLRITDMPHQSNPNSLTSRTKKNEYNSCVIERAQKLSD